MSKVIIYKYGEKIHPKSKLVYLREAEPYASPKGKHFRQAFFRCYCGVERKLVVSSVKTGVKKTCGLHVAKHGAAKTKLYGVWTGIKDRCLCENAPAYSNYGGRGIKMCKKWKNNFPKFRKWAVENGYAEGLQIDRINNDGDYEPNNCRFVSRIENNRNTRKSKWWVIDGFKYASSTEAAKAHNVSLRTIRRWCDGGFSQGKFYPSKENCYSEVKYN